MTKHPFSTYVFIWICDAVALVLFLLFMNNIEISQISLRKWLDFFMWTIILCMANLGGLFNIVGLNADTGWCTAVELAAALVLPFPLFSAAIYLSAIAKLIERLVKKVPEPFLGPDFNASNNIISAMIIKVIYGRINLLFSLTIMKSVVPLILGAFGFAICHIFLLTSLISFDSCVKWKDVDTLEKDFLATEFILIVFGIIIARIYQLDVSLISLVFIVLPILNNTLKKSNQAKLVFIDEKTGLYNYRFFDDKLSELNNKKVNYNQTHSMVFGDMDNLRDINNTYGHPVGDKAIITIAEVLKDCINENSYAIRFGGEEFILLLPECSKQIAMEIAEQARKKISDKSIPLDSGEILKITMSFGVATYPEDADTTDKLVKAADLAVYAAKKNGRNQVKAYRTFMQEVVD